MLRVHAAQREGSFKAFRLPDSVQFEGLDAALDSAGFVAAVQHRDYRWSVENHFDLVAAHPWKWAASMDYCCEREIAGDRPMRLLRMAATAFMLGRCPAGARGRGLQAPMPVLQGWTPDEYVMCTEWLPLGTPAGTRGGAAACGVRSQTVVDSSSMAPSCG